MTAELVLGWGTPIKGVRGGVSLCDSEAIFDDKELTL
jgi:hypothetical protein